MSSEKKKELIKKIALAVAIPALFAIPFIFYLNLKESPITLFDILKSGEITVITRNNSHTYYSYRDQPMGFEYDMAKAFADYLGVKLNVRVAEKWDSMIPDLKQGNGAFIAANLTILPQREEHVVFSDPYMSVRQRIVVHRKNSKLKKISNLSGETIHVRKGTSYQAQLEKLKKTGLNFEIKLHDDIPTEELIRMVEEKEIKITVADSNIALLNRQYYPETVMGGPISESQTVAWAVHPKSRHLIEQINIFLKTVMENGAFEEIYTRYYKYAQEFDYVDMAVYHRRISTHLPLYDLIIKKAARKYGFDWLMIAAQIYQESHFNPMAISPSAAYGLMQLTINTARSMGITDILDPEQNVMTGTKYLRKLHKLYRDADMPDQLFISLASYNIGQGHVRDAMNLARQMNLDPLKWSSLTKTLPLLQYRKYYKNTLYGYCRGNEPLRYVKQIMTYYDILKHMDMKLSGSQDPDYAGDDVPYEMMANDTTD